MFSALGGGISEHLKKERKKSPKFIFPWNESKILEYSLTQ